MAAGVSGRRPVGKPRIKWEYVVWWECVNSLQIRKWMAGVKNIEGRGKEIGVAVERKLL
jgi:hypothetical protein